MDEQLARRHADGWIATLYPLGKSSKCCLDTLITAMCPPDCPFPDGWGRVAQSVRQLMRYMHPLMAMGLRLGFHILDWSPIIRLRGIKRLRRLSPEQASQALMALSRSRVPGLPLLLTAVRAIILSSYFDTPEVHRMIDYTPRAFIKERILARQHGRDAAVSRDTLPMTGLPS